MAERTRVRSAEPPTLDEVASLAGVSRATASRAINGGSRVSPEALSAVQEAVAALGYVPNRAARSLVTRRTDSVAMVVPEPDERVFSDPFFSHWLRGVSAALEHTDVQLVLLLARPGDPGERTMRYLRNRHVDGALVISHHHGDGLTLELADMGLPCVFGGRPWSGADRISYVDVDNRAGGRLATEALVERGCRRIATVTGPPDMTASVDRLEGWRDALREAGLSDERVVHGDFTTEGGAQAMRQLLAEHPDTDGVFVASDLMASGALSVLAGRGLRVPDDIAIVGYDDLGVAERTDPPLTTIRQSTTDMAQRATALLLEQLRPGSVPVRHEILAPQLVRRASA
ncbi:MAG: LacI family DNA-binding transcriptional regulator [Actinomycetes bacterium]